MPDWLILASIIAGFFAIGWLISVIRDARRYRELKPRLDAVETAERELEVRKQEWVRKVESDRHALQQLATEKSAGFPWLAEAYADYFHLNDLKEASRLESKKHPAYKAADTVRDIAAKRRAAEKLHRVLKYQLNYYEKLFPWLEEFRQEDIDDLIVQVTSATELPADAEQSETDPVSRWLTAAEYQKLPSAERNQLALDRYWSHAKPPWEIGRDYERYIGYRYETAGGTVTYHGIIEGMADLGRDLIVTLPNGQVDIVQCKYWSSHKRIHEKHIFQLYGTVVAHRIDHALLDVKGIFYTSTELSERARQFASALGIKYFERQPLETYPAIKCNVSDRGKIYHLPFDQQYDRTLIRERNEKYVATVAEAEKLGFRRAFRWQGAKVHAPGA